MDGGFLVFTVSQDDLLTRVLKDAVRSDERVRVIDTVVDAATVSRQAAPHRSSVVVVVDIENLGEEGIALVGEIREAAEVPVLIATSDFRIEIVSRSVAAGACGVISTFDGAEELLSSIRRAIAGELVLPDQELSSLVDHLRSPADRLKVLTPRERETLELMADGRSTAEVAVRIGISPGTVQAHVKNVFAKLGVHSKVEAVRVALLAGAGSSSHSA